MAPNTTSKADERQSTHPSKSSAVPTDTPAQGTGTQTAPSGSPVAHTASYPTSFSLTGRILVTKVFPVVEDGRWPAKIAVDEVIPIRATVSHEGHDRYGVIVVLVRPDSSDGPSARMHDIVPGLDHHETSAVFDALKDWHFRVEGWSNPYAIRSHGVGIKVLASTDVELILEEGARVLDRAAALEEYDEERVEALNDAMWIVRDPLNPVTDRLVTGLSDSVQAALERPPLCDYVSLSTEYPFQVDRERALTGSWYEIFLCLLGSEADGDGSWHLGTLRSATERLDRIATIGSDVLYPTPISPIGLISCEGRNDTLTARPGDSGLPYGIGSPGDGHDAIHSDLGTSEDFDALAARPRELGMEVTLNLMLQCSPDHSWVVEHPRWFTVPADGSTAYVKNPPKKYQNIYPLNFDNDPEGTYQAILEVVRTWIAHGVAIFQVDSPHTKPLPFWQRLIVEIHAELPEVLFLTEAFTRSVMVCILDMIGFYQSHTYFAWCNIKDELIEYTLESSKDTAHPLRPALWFTTHDTLTPLITSRKVPAFKLYAVLTAMLSSTWGICSGYKLAESTSRPNYEEQIDNKECEYRPRDFAAARRNGTEDLLICLNAARVAHPVLRQLQDIHSHPTSDDQILAYLKRVDTFHSPTSRGDIIFTVVSLDSHRARAGEVYLDPEVLGLPDWVDASHSVVRVTDALTGDFHEQSRQNYICLDPLVEQVAHVLSVEPL